MVTRPDQQFGMENEDIFEEQTFPQYIPTPPTKPILNNLFLQSLIFVPEQLTIPYGLHQQ